MYRIVVKLLFSLPDTSVLDRKREAAAPGSEKYSGALTLSITNAELKTAKKSKTLG